MKKKYLVLSLFLVVAFATITTKTANSKLASPPEGSVGDPIDTLTCAQSGCHAGPAQAPSVGDVTINIGTGTPSTPLNSSFAYTPGATYNIAFLINLFATTNPYYGFQIAALDGTNNQAGNMIVTDASSTKINLDLTRQYMGHKNARSIKNWVFQWTAPTAATGPVTFYYCFNVANADSVPPTEPEGIIYHSTITIQEGPSGINDIANKMSALTIFPNPVSNEFRISFNLKNTDKVSAKLYSLDGKLNKELVNENMNEGNFNRSFDISTMPAGIYLLKMNIGESFVTEKIVKL